MGDTWTQIRARARLYARDTSTTNPGVSDANMLVLFNARYRAYFAKFEPRLVKHTGATTGLLLDPASPFATTTRTDYARFHAVYLEVANSTTDGTQIRILTLDEVLKSRDDTIGQGNAAPTACAIYRAASTTTAQQGKWKFEMNNYPDAGYYLSVLAELHATDLALVTDTPDVTPEGAADLAVLTAYDMGLLLNRPDSFLQGILSKSASIERVMALVADAGNAPLVRSPAGRLAVA